MNFDTTTRPRLKITIWITSRPARTADVAGFSVLVGQQGDQMTAEDELLLLEARRIRGELSDAEYETEKYRIMSTQPIEGASPPPWDPSQATQEPFPAQPPSPGMAPYTPYGQTYGSRPPIGYTKPSSYLALAIISTLISTFLCCLPVGIVGIVYAAQVDSKWNGGDYYGAQRASKNAKTWSLVSIGMGSISVGFIILGQLLGSSSSTTGY